MKKRMGQGYVIVFLLAFAFHEHLCSYEDDEVNQAVKQFIDHINLTYDKRLLPQLPNNSKQHQIVATVGIHGIYDVSEHDSSLVLSYALKLQWMDKRFKFKPMQFPDGHRMDSLVLPIDAVVNTGMHKLLDIFVLFYGFQRTRMCWLLHNKLVNRRLSIKKPAFVSVFLWDIVLKNEKDTNGLAPEKVSPINADLRFRFDGVATYRRDVVSRVRCLMDLRSYPHDVQTCHLKFQSHVYPNNIVNFTNSSVKISEEALESSTLDILSFDAFEKTVASHEENFSMCVVEIDLHRRLEYFLYQVKLFVCS